MGQYDLTVGVYLLGIFLNTFLYGLVFYQFIQYYRLKFRDAFWIRFVVGTLFALDTLHSAVELYAAWEMCVINYDNPGSLRFVSWTIPFTACATAMAALITQIFLCHRVMILCNSYVIPAVILTLSFVSFVFGNVAGIKSGILRDVTLFPKLKPFVICWLGFQTTADILLTSVLAYTLAHIRTGFARTDHVINRLIRGAVQTGLFASLFAMGDLFSFLFANPTNLYALFAFPLGRIYTNTLLDTLICRPKDIRGRPTTGGPEQTESAIQFSSVGSHRAQSSRIQSLQSSSFPDHRDEINLTSSMYDNKPSYDRDSYPPSQGYRKDSVPSAV